MMLAGASLASCALASLTPLSTATTDADGGQPLNVLLDGVFYRQYILAGSLSIDDTLGEQASCTFTIVNPMSAPVIGNAVEVRYFSEILFAGTIDRIARRSNNLGTYRTYECTCTDWSQILVRNKIERNFTDLPLVNIVDALLDNELNGEGLTLGTVDRGTTIPLVDSRGGSAFDVLRDASGITGQTMYVDWSKAIQFRSTTNPEAPVDLDQSHVERAEVVVDRETYRNVQRVKVIGTPSSASTTDAAETVQERTNDDQIAARAAIEGGSGRYESYEEITHPTSNDGADIALLGIGYANLLLATSGTLRQTLRCRVRNYGFRAGQFATVDLSLLEVSGTWLIQRATVQDEDGKRLIHELELVQSSLQQRAYESWLKIVRGGKITVQMPGALTGNRASFTTSGSWVVPSGVTSVTITCVGGSGGGGGGTYIYWSGFGGIASVNWHDGGAGGASGKAIAIVSVVADQTLTITVGTAGTAGANAQSNNTLTSVAGTNGTNGTASSVTLDGGLICQGNGGTKGFGSTTTNDGFYIYGGSNGANGESGSGQGDAVSTGGGRRGGDAGTGNPYVAPTAGEDGYVEIAW